MNKKQLRAAHPEELLEWLEREIIAGYKATTDTRERAAFKRAAKIKNEIRIRLAYAAAISRLSPMNTRGTTCKPRQGS